MTLEEFAELVLTMRLAQNAYFEDRSRNNLLAAKEAEGAVDNALLTILPDMTVRSTTTGRIKRRTPRPDPMPTQTVFGDDLDGGPHGWW